jgi:hypothetical protein
MSPAGFTEAKNARGWIERCFQIYAIQDILRFRSAFLDFHVLGNKQAPQLE